MANVKRWESGDKWIEVDLDLCVGAGNCENICPVNVYKVVNGIVDASNIEECISCAACQDACMQKTILKHHAW